MVRAGRLALQSFVLTPRQQTIRLRPLEVQGRGRYRRQPLKTSTILSIPWCQEVRDAVAGGIRRYSEDKKRRMPTNVKTYDGIGDPDWLSMEETPATRIPPKALKRPPSEEHCRRMRKEESGDQGNRLAGRLGRTLAPQRIERRMQEGEPIDTINLDDPYELEPLGLEEEEPTNRRTSAHKRLGARGTNASNPKGQELPNHAGGEEVIARHTSAHERLGPRRENGNSTPYSRGVAQRKKYSKNPVELARIRQRSGEYLDSFTERFKDEMVYFKHCPDLMKISAYMNGINNQDLIKKLNDKVPQTFDELMRRVRAFIRAEDAAADSRRGYSGYRAPDQPKTQFNDRGGNRRRCSLRKEPIGPGHHRSTRQWTSAWVMDSVITMEKRATQRMSAYSLKSRSKKW
ncbi:hypothetical protein Tco_1032777 [Tanacetum coccineum]|uniref:Reverse transcriptase domain-containing protein n=1 Tax=Tanacetum coccineum TaxID=301880 RepID=A0ABQ5GD93_9ASTR